MTLIIGMSKPEGIYLSADYRVTDSRSGALLDDASIKTLTIHYPPLDNHGPRVLMGFSGLAMLRDGTPTMTWIRQTLRGENEVIDQSMQHLLRRLNRDIAPLRTPLVINLLVLRKDRRFMGGFSNMRITPLGQLTVERSFGYVMNELDDWTIFANGCGFHRLLKDGHLARLQPHLNIVPREAMNHMKLLAVMNRRVAAKDRRVSPFCSVSYINSDDRFQPVSHSFTERNESVPFEMPILYTGIDVTEFHREIWQGFQEKLRTGDSSVPMFDEAKAREAVRRRP